MTVSIDGIEESPADESVVVEEESSSTFDDDAQEVFEFLDLEGSFEEEEDDSTPDNGSEESIFPDAVEPVVETPAPDPNAALLARIAQLEASIADRSDKLTTEEFIAKVKSGDIKLDQKVEVPQLITDANYSKLLEGPESANELFLEIMQKREETMLQSMQPVIVEQAIKAAQLNDFRVQFYNSNKDLIGKEDKVEKVGKDLLRENPTLTAAELTKRLPGEVRKRHGLQLAAGNALNTPVQRKPRRDPGFSGTGGRGGAAGGNVGGPANAKNEVSDLIHGM